MIICNVSGIDIVKMALVGVQTHGITCIAISRVEGVGPGGLVVRTEFAVKSLNLKPTVLLIAAVLSLIWIYMSKA